MDMSLDAFKSKVGSLLEKKNKNEEDQKEIKDAAEKFGDADIHAPNLDDMIRESMENIRSGLQENYNYITEEQKMIQEDRSSLASEIQNELAKLNDAQAKLDESTRNQYGSHFHDALNACKNCIKDYESLLELMEMNSSHGAGAGGAVSMEAYQKEKAFATELQVREQAINMLVSMTPSQRAAVKNYTGSDYVDMNSALRAGKHSEKESVNQSISELHSLLKDRHASTPVTLYRGISSDVTMVPGSKKGLDQFSDQELCGKLLADRAFVSTSLREGDAFNKPTVLVLNAPAGTCGAYVGDISTLENYESEFLMDCGQIFKVTRIERRDGKRYIHANVLVRPSVSSGGNYTRGH